MQPLMLLASLGLSKGHLPGSVWLITQEESHPRRGRLRWCRYRHVFPAKSCTGERELLAVGGSVETFMQKAGSVSLSCCGVGSLQTALSILPTSADENQTGLCLVGVSVNKGVQKLTA